jgi:hypothetical protein
MSHSTEASTAQDMITKTMQFYIDGLRSGKGDEMKPAFHADATIFGYVGADLFAGPIQLLFDWCDESGPSPDLKEKIANIDVVGSIATVRLELKNLIGYQFTDQFTLLKVDGTWKIMNKVFHLHA